VSIAVGGAIPMRRWSKDAKLTRDATGGSTGEPTVVWHGPQERGWAESGIEHSLARAGAPRGTSIGFLWGHHLDPVTRDRVRPRTRDPLTNVRWFDCFRLSPAKLDAYHHELQGWRPACVVATLTIVSCETILRLC